MEQKLVKEAVRNLRLQRIPTVHPLGVFAPQVELVLAAVAAEYQQRKRTYVLLAVAAAADVESS